MGDAAVEVFHAIGRRGVNQARAVLGRGVVGQVDRAESVVAGIHMGQRMLEVDAAQGLAHGGGNDRAGELVALQALVDQALGQHQQAARRVHQGVGQLRVQVERLVGRQGPRGGGPDDGEGFLFERLQAESLGQPGGFRAQEADVQRLRLLVGVFDLELGQRRAAVKAPIDRLQAAVDKAALHDALEGADLIGLVAEIHGAVGMFPVAQHAQALEVGALDVDLLGGIGAALGLHLVARQVAAELLLDGVLDRQAVAVPAGDVVPRPSPLSWRALTIMSFRILLTAWPMWIWPLA